MSFPITIYVAIFIVGSVLVVGVAEEMGYDFDLTEESPDTEQTTATVPDQTEDNSPEETGQTTTSTSPTTTVSTTSTTTTTILITAQRLQDILQTEDAFTSLPSNSRIAITFFDGNGHMRSEKFLVQGGGEVSPYSGDDYHVKLSTGDYYLDDMEATDDLCALFTELKEKQEVLVEVKDPFASFKYMDLANCVPFT